MLGQFSHLLLQIIKMSNNYFILRFFTLQILTDQKSSTMNSTISSEPDPDPKPNNTYKFKLSPNSNTVKLCVDQCTLGSLSDKNSPRILNFQCLVDHEINFVTAGWDPG